MMDLSLIGQLALLSIVLTVIAIVDFRTQTIPDIATLALACIGALFQYANSFDAFQTAAWSGSVYFGLFWIIRRGHLLLTGRLGMGFGDVKFAGAAGVWLSVPFLPAFMGTAAISALLSIGVFAAYAGMGVLTRRIPFGPFLALSLLSCWLFKTSNISWELFYEG